MFQRLPRSLCAIVLLGLVVGCQIVPDAKPDPTKFFVLEDPGATTVQTTDPDGVTIGLLGVRLPVYLADSRAIAITSPEHQVEFRDFERWAEPLHEGIERVLRSALSRTPEISRVRTPPRGADSTHDYELHVTVLNCEGFRSGKSLFARFACDYTILTPDGELVSHGIYQAPAQTWNGQSGDLARLLSQAVVDGAAAIAAAIPAQD